MKNSFFKFLKGNLVLLILFQVFSLLAEESGNQNPSKPNGSEPREEVKSVVRYFTPEMANRIEYYVEKKFQEADIPGGIVVVVEGEEVVMKKGIGYSNRRKGQLFTHKTVFNSGTLSAHFTRLAILKMVEEDLISLETPLAQVLPELKLGIEGKEKILTINNLLYNTTGLTYQAERTARRSDGHLSPDADEILASLGEFRDLDRFTDIYRENNLDFLILSEIVQRRARIPLSLYLKEKFFQPLGMNDTTYSLYSALKKGATGYGYLWGKRKEISFQEVPEVFAPSQRIFISGEDISRLLLLHTSEKETLPLPRTRISDMYSLLVREDTAGGMIRGMGFRKDDLVVDSASYLHLKGLGASGSLYILNNKKLAFALFTNTSSNPATRTISEGIFSILHNLNPLEIPLSIREKNIGLFGLLLLLVSLVLSIVNAYLVMHSFSFVDYTGEDRLPLKFILALTILLSFVWIRFLLIPGSDLFGDYTVLPYDSAPGGWMIELYYGFAGVLMCSILYASYYSYLILKSNRNRTGKL